MEKQPSPAGCTFCLFPLLSIGMQLPVNPDLLAASQEAVAAWAPLASHPHLAVLRAAFAAADAAGQACLCVSHTLFPGAATLQQAHLQPSATSTGLMRSNNATEDTLWSYLVQVNCHAVGVQAA